MGINHLLVDSIHLKFYSTRQRRVGEVVHPIISPAFHAGLFIFDPANRIGGSTNKSDYLLDISYSYKKARTSV